jgi:hypothetical protein
MSTAFDTGCTQPRTTMHTYTNTYARHVARARCLRHPLVPQAHRVRATCARRARSMCQAGTGGPRHAATRPLSLLLLRRATHSRMHTRRLQEAPPRRHAAVAAHALKYSLCTHQGGEKVSQAIRGRHQHTRAYKCVTAGESEERTARLSGHEWRAAVGVPTCKAWSGTHRKM